MGGLMLPTPTKASSPSPASLSLKNPEVPQCLACENRRKTLAECYYTKEGVQDSLHQSQPFPPLHTAAMSLPALVQNEAINPNRAKFCHEKLPEPMGRSPFPPPGNTHIS